MFRNAMLSFALATASTTAVLAGGVAAIVPVEAAAAAVSDRGTFRGAGSHDVKGTAEIVRLRGGGHALKLHGNFRTDSAPDLRVWLSEAGDPGSRRAVSAREHIDLGALKSSSGEQLYRIPASVDLAKVRSAVIWCRAFGVFFGGASLA